MSSTSPAIAAPKPPSAAASTAILTLLASLTLCALVLVMLAAPDAPFTPQWPWQWAAICAGVVATLGVALSMVWRERQLALCWYSIAMTAQNQAQHAAQAAAATAGEDPLDATQQLVLAKSQEMVVAITTLVELAETSTAALEQQRAVLQTLTAAKSEVSPLSLLQPAPQTASAMYDPLTGAVAHSAFMTRLEPDVEFARQHQRPLALALFDINDFGAINLRFGYAFGDDVLFAVAERLRGAIGEGDMLARLGANCFAIVWPGLSAQPAQAAVERVIDAVTTRPLMIPTSNALKVAEMVQITLRAGLALCPDDGYAAHALVKLAEEALAGNAQRPPRQPDMVMPWPPERGDADVTTETTYAELPAITNPSPSAPAQSLTPVSYIDAMAQQHSSIQALTSALEAQDPEGIARARVLAELAEATAIIMGRAIEEARLVGLGALLHDVGNLGIPAEILEKPEPLTSEEWAFVRKHPHLGHRLLSSVGGVLAAVAAIVASHRERWDGKGYPAGIQGEHIPLGARIVAVCDVYGALISARPYRPAHSVEEATAEITKHAGTQFDPAVVKAFTQALQQH